MDNLDLQRERVKKIMDKWLEPLGLAHWRVDVLWVDERIRNDNGDEVVFRISVLPQYMSAEIRAFENTLITLDDAHLEECVVHELVHIFLAEFEHEQDDYHWHVDHVCTRLAKAFRWVKRYAEDGDMK